MKKKGRATTKTTAATAITSDQMYSIEENGHSEIGMRRFLMMENAGHGISDFIAGKFKNYNLKNKKIVAVCGTGNNGGDGLVAVRHLAGYGAKASVVLLGSPSDIKSEEARLNWGIVEKMDSVEIIFGKEVSDAVRKKIMSADIILDGIFGTGIKREIKEPHASAIDAINNSKKQAYVLAIDIPSGLDPNTGSVYNDKAVRADATITFHRMKKGLVAKGARKYTGPVYVEQIGIPPEAERGVI
ncbi:yjeF-like protein [Candidatus Nitrososphaera evergladensis SR1]|uniref:NAD(P)H-hydrate epimerase n=1 Tax=Candidatus Nitrososphaera evergladensis SR1 TaxID=1459636 RepID=A0A075MQX9_9ARCH|nr:NAD(P)H-hydrate epimerase [Candidatus Nitrososphaera evergladensis]AIF83618.1 yjeF-like protein [Candidatus Nitrososphaera evergladensis SR1]